MKWPSALELSAKHKKSLQEESIRHFEAPIIEMGKTELREHFGAKTTRRINRSELIKNIIWQTYEQLKLQQRERFEGNIRSFWYSHVKPTLSRANALSDSSVAYKTMIDMFVRLVMARELLRYRDFGFADERAENRQIGDKNGHILLAAEKRGQWHLLRRIAEDFDVTIVALGGQPSLLSTEYFAEELAAAGIDLAQPLPLLTIVDYDPAGDSIARTFIRQLKTFGATEVLRTDLAMPVHMTEEQIQLNRYRLSRKKRQRKKVSRWLGLTGGLDRKPYGLEADALTTEQLVAVFEQAVAVYLKLGVEQVRRRRRKRQLVRLIKRKILQRLGLE